MAIPDYETLMLPVLKEAAGGEVAIRECVRRIADQLGLSEIERNELLPSGKQTTFANRVHWARTYLAQAGLVEATRRGHFKITDRGRSAIGSSPDAINNDLLQDFPEFQDFKRRRKPNASPVLEKDASASEFLGPVSSQSTSHGRPAMETNNMPSHDIEANNLPSEDVNASVPPEEDEGDLITTTGEKFVVMQPKDITVFQYKRWHEQGKLNLNPDWQREYVWRGKRPSQFIESLLMRVPIPVIFLARTKDGKYEVIDGVQRLTTAFNYLENKIPSSAHKRVS